MINVAIIGVGSLAKALLEGVSFYTLHPDAVQGLAHPVMGGYKVSDIQFVAAFDVDTKKVGLPIHQAISQGLNVSYPICETIPFKGMVHKGPCLDGLIPAFNIQESQVEHSDIANILTKTKTDIVLNLLPSGSNAATAYYAEQALIAGCHFINAIPTPLATIKTWQQRFSSKGLVLMGDDIKSQFGATMLNRLIIQALKERGLQISSSHQHNKGGNADHLNLIYRTKEKMESKKHTIEHFVSEDDGEVSVSFEYTGLASSHKEVNIVIEALYFGKTPMTIEATIHDEISLNGAGTIVDAIRAVKLIADHKADDAINKVCPYLFKNPPQHLSDNKATIAFDQFLKALK